MFLPLDKKLWSPTIFFGWEFCQIYNLELIANGGLGLVGKDPPRFEFSCQQESVAGYPHWLALGLLSLAPYLGAG